jgi:hypothetical protein
LNINNKKTLNNNELKKIKTFARFNSETKNYKVYFDGAFYVGEKRFDTIADLVHDGLISFYIEKHASNYIAMMAEENNYAESPYVASRNALFAQQQKKHPSLESDAPQSSIHSSFQKQYQQQQQHQQLQQTASPHLSTHKMFQQAVIETAQSSSNMNQLDKENRLFSSFESKLAPKSNAIFDRFDIMNSEKQHRFKSQNFKGPHWCDFCLNFMWGLVSQGVKCQDCGFQAHKYFKQPLYKN